MDFVKTADTDRVKALAKSQGITVAYLCDSIGKYKGFFIDLKRGKARITTDELAIIADRLHTTPEYLTGVTDDPLQPAQPDAPAPSADDDAVTPEFLATLSPSTRQIYELVESLPDDKRQEAIDYIQFIISRSEKRPPKQK